MSTLKLFLFGPPRVELDGAPLEFNRRKALALLIYLAVSGQTHSRDALATLFWPDHDQSRGRAYLRRDLAILNSGLTGDWLAADRETVELKREVDPAADLGQVLWLDVAHFSHLLATCRSHDHPPEGVCAECLPLLTEAVALYAADFLAGFTLRDSPEFDDWQFFQTESLRQELAWALERLVRGHSDRGQYEAAIPYARRWLALDPLHEPAQRHLIQLYDQAGQPSAALRQYEEYVNLLEEEFGLPPEEEITTLYEAIKAKRMLGSFLKGEQQRRDQPRQAHPEPEQEQYQPSGLAASSPDLSTRSMPVEAPDRRQEIRFCTAADGVRIAYATVGRGPALVKAANWLSHLEFDWNSPVWRHWLTALSEHYTLVRYDERGCGLSDWEVPEFSLDHFVQDLEAVVDTLGLDRFPLLGVSQGGPVAIAYSVRHPEKVSHLILYGTYLRGRAKRLYSQAEIEKAQMLSNMIKLGWGKDNPAFRQFFTTLFMPEATAEQMQWFNDLQRISTSPEIAVRIRMAFNAVDVTHLAPQVTVPTLILHARSEEAVPLQEARHLAAAIPQARFVPLEGKNHILLETEPAWPQFLAEVHQFVQTETEAPKRPVLKRKKGEYAGQGQRFVQETLIATGGMGEVYQGRDTETGQRVAIKRLKPELVARNPEAVRRLIREGEVLRRLNHPNIVKVLATIETDGQPSIVMEYLPGGSLKDLLAQQPQLPLARVFDIGLELADALARTHHLGIIHRDLKPANVLLAADGAPRLTDFGVAYLARQETRLTYEGEILGTSVYMSPEAWRGQELDARSDIWSFGALLYEMVAGQAPFEAEQVVAVMTAILNDPLPDLARFRSDVPPALVALIDQMLVKDREQRIDSMRQVAAALEVIQRRVAASSP